MVDTLAPKRVFTQRDLDQSLIQPTPVGKSIMAPATNVLDASPALKTQVSLMDTPQPDYVIDKNQIFNMMQNVQRESASRVAETSGTVKSSEETIKEKQTGMRTERQETPQSEGLVMRPVEYAADGVKDKEVSGPILVGEKGAELVVPTGEGKVSILDAKTTSGLMQFPGYGDEMITTKEVSPGEQMFKKKEKTKNFRGGSKNFRNQEEFERITRADEGEDFVNYMKKIENAQLLAGDTSMLQHDSAEGGNKTIAYGHKLTDAEVKSGKVYGFDIANLTTDQANEILKLDLSKAYKQLTDKFGREFLNLDDRRKQMLVDMQFNLGSLNAFPKFTTAVFAGDESTMMKEYKRSFKDPESGEMKPLKGRNTDFDKFFFGSKEQSSLMTKPVKKAEKGAKNVEIGKPEPVGFLGKPGEKMKELAENLFGPLPVLPDFLLPDKDNSSLGNPPNQSYKLGPPPSMKKETFDPSKLLDPDAATGLNIDYFYDNLDEMAEYSIKLKKGQDYTPTPEEQEAEIEDLTKRYDALFDLQLSDTEEEIEERNFSERSEMDPDFSIGI
tara:strand:- start:102 stop:1769 length:1668 start_codon:yes stop_codon:yes gene_type:complete